MNNYSQGPLSWIMRIPPVTRALLVINIGIWIACAVSPTFYHIATGRLGLRYWSVDDFNPIQLVTYQFMHGGFTHLLFNMFALYMFGSLLERVWGTGRYVIFYFVCGIGAGLVQECIWTLTWQHDYMTLVAGQNGLEFNEIKEEISSEIFKGLPERMENVDYYLRSMVTVGASGAIFGLLVGFAFVFPDMPMYIFFIPIPVKAKWVAVGYGVIELAFGATGTMSSVAHYAHLGGMLFALIMILYWHLNGTLRGKYF